MTCQNRGGFFNDIKCHISVSEIHTRITIVARSCHSFKTLTKVAAVYRVLSERAFILIVVILKHIPSGPLITNMNTWIESLQTDAVPMATTSSICCITG